MTRPGAVLIGRLTARGGSSASRVWYLVALAAAATFALLLLARPGLVSADINDPACTDIPGVGGECEYTDPSLSPTFIVPDGVSSIFVEVWGAGGGGGAGGHYPPGCNDGAGRGGGGGGGGGYSFATLSVTPGQNLAVSVGGGGAGGAANATSNTDNQAGAIRDPGADGEDSDFGSGMVIGGGGSGGASGWPNHTPGPNDGTGGAGGSGGQGTDSDGGTNGDTGSTGGQVAGACGTGYGDGGDGGDAAELLDGGGTGGSGAGTGPTPANAAQDGNAAGGGGGGGRVGPGGSVASPNEAALATIVGADGADGLIRVIWVYDDEGPFDPTVTKTGVSSIDGLFTWRIRIDNDPSDTEQDVVDSQVRITDPNVTLQGGLLDGNQCVQFGSVIRCDVDAWETIRIIVTRHPGNPSCEPIAGFNSITKIEVRHWDGEEWGEWEDLGPGPQNRIAWRPGDPRLCPTLTPPPPPGWTPTPTPTATPTPTPAAGCLNPPVAHATWHPTPVVPGRTISIWGGGNVSQFPLPIATSYWTTVNGLWVGYIPGAPNFVNANFFAHFPNGNIPPCKGFIISHFR